MTSVEQKYDDVSLSGTSTRVDKDDYKAQAFQARVGTKEVPTEFREAVADAEQPASGSLGHVLDEVTGLQGKTNVNAALAPMVHTAELQSGKEGLDHVTGLQKGKFGSVHDSGAIIEESIETTEVEEPSVVTFHNRPIAHSPPSLQKPLIHRGSSGDPLPSQLELPGMIGEAAGKGWDAIQERARPQIEKAKELYHIWKGEERRVSGDGESMPGMSAFRAQQESGSSRIDGIKLKASHVLEDQIKPGVAKIQAKANELLHRNVPKERGTTERKARTFKAAPREMSETIGHRMVRYKNKLIELWDGEEPLVKSKIQQGVQVLKDYRMDIPMLALATLLVLWASVSFVTWMAFPAKLLNEQVVLYDGTHAHDGHPLAHENEFSAWNVPDFQHEVDYPHGDQKLAPMQGAKNAGLKDRRQMNMKGRVSGEMHNIAMHGTDRVGHLKDAMPSLGGLKDKATDRMHHLKDAIPTSLGDLKDSIAMHGTDRLHHLKDAIPTSLGGLKDSIVGGMRSLKKRARGSLGIGSDQNMDLYELNHQLGDDDLEDDDDWEDDEGGMEADDADAPPHWHTAPEAESQSKISHEDIEEALQKDLHGGDGGVPQHQHNQQMGDAGVSQQQQQQQQRTQPSGERGVPQHQHTQQDGVQRDVGQQQPQQAGVQRDIGQQQAQQHQMPQQQQAPVDPRNPHVKPPIDRTARPAPELQQQQMQQQQQQQMQEQQRIQQQHMQQQQQNIHPQHGNPSINQQGVRQGDVPGGVQQGIPQHQHTMNQQQGIPQQHQQNVNQQGVQEHPHVTRIPDQQQAVNQQPGVPQHQHTMNQAQGQPQPGIAQSQPGVVHTHTDGSQVGTLKELEERQLGAHHEHADPKVDPKTFGLSQMPTTAQQASDAPDVRTGQVPPQAAWATQPNDRIGDPATRLHPDHIGQQNMNQQQARPQSAIPVDQRVHAPTEPVGTTQPASAGVQQPNQAMPNGELANGRAPQQPHVHHQHMHTVDANGQPIQGQPAPGQPHTHIVHDHVHTQQPQQAPVQQPQQPQHHQAPPQQPQQPQQPHVQHAQQPPVQQPQQPTANNLNANGGRVV